jgi:hypothetical protein
MNEIVVYAGSAFACFELACRHRILCEYIEC